MAKITPINIAITGDAKGFAAATDAAVREMRRLQAASETTNRRLTTMRQTVDRTATAVAKFGVPGATLGPLSGAFQLANLGLPGLGLAGAAGVGAAATTTMAAIMNVDDIQARVKRAMDEVAMDGRKRMQQFGFSPQMAQAISENTMGPQTAGQTLGVFDSFTAGLASGRAGAAAGDYFSSMLPVLATAAGGLLGGAGISETQQLAASQLTSGDAAADTLRAYNIQSATFAPGGPVGYLLSQFFAN